MLDLENPPARRDHQGEASIGFGLGGLQPVDDDGGATHGVAGAAHEELANGYHRRTRALVARQSNRDRGGRWCWSGRRCPRVRRAAVRVSGVDEGKQEPGGRRAAHGSEPLQSPSYLQGTRACTT